MNITLERIIPIEDAFERLRQAPLDAAGDPDIRIYANAHIRLADFYPRELNPTSLYVLRKNLDTQRRIRDYLLEHHQIDTLQLSSILCLRTEKGLEGMAPPYVETYQERVNIIPKDGDKAAPSTMDLRIPILKDGIHRAWLAEELGSSLRCVAVSDVPKEYLPYAYPNDWDSVGLYDEVPVQKKFYRRQDPYTFMRPIRVLRQTDNAPTPVQWGRT